MIWSSHAGDGTCRLSNATSGSSVACYSSLSASGVVVASEVSVSAVVDSSVGAGGVTGAVVGVGSSSEQAVKKISSAIVRTSSLIELVFIR